MPRENERKLEKKAKYMLINKNIPPDKMDIVRSLLHNNSLSGQEKYSAVIDIIKFCPDKTDEKKSTPKNKSVTEPERSIKDYFFPYESSQFVNQIYYKYKSTKLFKKRYLVHVNNRFGIGIQKRLIPSRKLFRAMIDIVAHQEKILSRLSDLLMGILKDESIDNPTHFNYLRILRRWMMETPIIKYNMYEIKWMTPTHIEAELRSYIINYFSFFKLDIETKEQILLIVENKLRLMDDLKKEDINSTDPIGLKCEKEKRNLKREKIIYDYMITLRSFLQSNFNRSDILSDYVKVNYGINSFPEFLIILMEALVFQREIELKDIIKYYNIKPHSVSSENWDYSTDFLKEIGKDPESKRKKRLQKLKDELIPYDELYSFLKLRIDGQIMLQNAIETQWKFADKKQKDYTYIYNDDFLTFIDTCINYFNNSFVPFLNGEVITFQDKNQSIFDGNIFSPGFFASELNSVSSLLSELHSFKSSNPRLVVSRVEAMKILQGKLRSMFEIERFITLTGEIFYQIGEKLQTLYDQHRLWILNGSKTEDPRILYTPVKQLKEDDKGAPIPFHNCTIIDFKQNRLLTDKLIGKNILTDSTRGGIIINLNAFSYQLAYECLNDNINLRLERRKEILNMIKESGGQ